MERRLSGIERRLSGIERSQSGIERRLSGIERSQSGSLGRIRQIKKHIGGLESETRPGEGEQAEMRGEGADHGRGAALEPLGAEIAASGEAHPEDRETGGLGGLVVGAESAEEEPGPLGVLAEPLDEVPRAPGLADFDAGVDELASAEEIDVALHEERVVTVTK